MTPLLMSKSNDKLDSKARRVKNSDWRMSDEEIIPLTRARNPTIRLLANTLLEDRKAKRKTQ